MVSREGADCWKGMAAGLGMTEGRKQVGLWRYWAVARGQMCLAATVHRQQIAARKGYSRRWARGLLRGWPQSDCLHPLNLME